MLLPAFGADKAIHQLNAGGTADNGDRFPIDRFNGIDWHNFYLTVADLKSQLNIAVYYTTNNIVYSTNYFISDSYVSNYFFTNVYLDTYMSNFYQTNFYTTNNTWNYNITTNTYTTNIVNENSYPSNFFQTNIFFVDNTVSNFFLTNITYWTTNFTQQITTNTYAYTTNFYSTNIYASYINTTNLYTSNLFTTNIYATTIYSSNIFTTNLYAGDTYTTNLYVTNINAKNITVQNFYSTSNFLDNVTITNQIMWVTNSWAGPTNPVNIGGPYDQNFAATSDCQVTGITNKTSYTTCEILLSVYNTVATNITVRFPASVMDGDYVSSHTITNGTVGYFWLRYTPVGPRTNNVFRQM